MSILTSLSSKEDDSNIFILSSNFFIFSVRELLSVDKGDGIQAKIRDVNIGKYTFELFSWKIRREPVKISPAREMPNWE